MRMVRRYLWLGSVTKTASGSSIVFAPELAVMSLEEVVLLEEVRLLEEAQAAVMASTPAAPVPTEACVINLRRVNFSIRNTPYIESL